MYNMANHTSLRFIIIIITIIIIEFIYDHDFVKIQRRWSDTVT